MDFTLYKGVSGTNVDIIDQKTGVPTTLVVNQPTLNRYMATWKLRLSQNIDLSATYRIQAKLKCERQNSRSPFSAVPQKMRVLAAESKNSSFLDSIVNFFSSLFGQQTQNTPPQDTPTAVTTPRGDQIKLGTFYPAKVEQGDNCTFLRFKF